MHKGYMFSKYALDKDLKDVGGLWSRVDFRDYIITPKKVWLANKWFQAGCFLQRPAKGMRRRRKCIKSADGGKVWVTIYEPVNISKNAPCMVYYHGGAFVLRDRPSTHRLAQVYAESIRCKVVIVHYRLGEPYPIPVKDCYRALVWVAHNAEKLGIDKDRIAVVGDSAGGALAAAVTLLARDKNGPSICFQMLINPGYGQEHELLVHASVCGFARLECQFEQADVGSVPAFGRFRQAAVCRSHVRSVPGEPSSRLCGNTGD